eukprot:CAMPEP_0196656788 /NCGR_PEP_ID=MMETSP1086-20130531/19507_1 /TAXON_ID=77921 /ORGANISM="Cyanoptyche  gloeocystis , Strain SAG4.97" /LENGTH=449 /DNA_ID=CAMNT_0041989661 /DNA_START=202 /DNA_END=1551 /DNA_ORIENTATION=-
MQQSFRTPYSLDPTIYPHQQTYFCSGQWNFSSAESSAANRSARHGPAAITQDVSARNLMQPAQERLPDYASSSSGNTRRRVDPRARHSFYNKSKTSPPPLAKTEAESQPRADAKLDLVLDLDNTLIHATSDIRAKSLVQSEDEIDSFLLIPPPHVKAAPFQVYVKQRPGLKAFLEQVSDLYNLHIYTMGTREYADGISKIIDPEGRMLTGRIVSRDESVAASRAAQTKDLSMIFKDDNSRVVVLDDREDVWIRGGAQNLVKIEPFVFFVGLKSMNESLATGSSSVHSEQAAQAVLRASKAAEDDHLAGVLRVLRMVYRKFAERVGVYSSVHVKDILAEVKKTVLQDVRLVFVGLLPPDQKPQNQALWLRATSFGATCFTLEEVTASESRQDLKITHVVASRSELDKVRDQYKVSCTWIVSWRWLVDSMKNWKRAEEDKYSGPNDEVDAF